MAELAGSLGLDSQVDALLNGDPLERATARIVVRGASEIRQRRDKNLAVYLSQAMNGSEIG